MSIVIDEDGHTHVTAAYKWSNPSASWDYRPYDYRAGWQHEAGALKRFNKFTNKPDRRERWPDVWYELPY